MRYVKVTLMVQLPYSDLFNSLDSIHTWVGRMLILRVLVLAANVPELGLDLFLKILNNIIRGTVPTFPNQ